MKNIKPFMKRVVAYTIDIVIILVVSTLIINIPFVSKNMEDYQKTNKEYVEKYNLCTEYINTVISSYKDEKITEEEYNKLIESLEYKEIVENKYEDKKISQDEYDDIIQELAKKQHEITKEYDYELSKKGILSSSITLVCTALYFGVLQYFLKGETIGKKLFKLKVVSANDKKLNIFNYLFRSLIINDVLLNTIGILFLAFAKKSVYLEADSLITTLVSVVEAVIIFLVLTREDQRGLHDLLFNTKVISTVENNKEDNKIIEVEEKEVKDGKQKRKKQ